MRRPALRRGGRTLRRGDAVEVRDRQAGTARAVYVAGGGQTAWVADRLLEVKARDAEASGSGRSVRRLQLGDLVEVRDRELGRIERMRFVEARGDAVVAAANLREVPSRQVALPEDAEVAAALVVADEVIGRYEGRRDAPLSAAERGDLRSYLLQKARAARDERPRGRR